MAKQRLGARDFSMRLAITLFVALTFVLQGYATQTHVHFSADRDTYVNISDGSIAKATKALPSQKGDHGKLPSKDDPANCPLCQQILVAGAFVSPTTVAVLLPTLLPLPAPIVFAASNLFRSISHSWRGRAPPAV
jgi:hypothetical protein